MSKKAPDNQGKNTQKVGRGNPPVETRWKPGQSGQHDVTLSEVTGNFNAALIVADNVAVTPVFTVRTIGEAEEKQPETLESPDIAM